MRVWLQSVNGTHVNNELIGKDNRKNLEYGDIIMLTNDLKYKFESKEALPEDDEFVAVAEAVMDSVDMTDGVTKSVDVAEAAADVKKNVPEASSLKSEEDELTCSVCTELFIEAVTLGCSHTFCKFCIEQWRKNADLCPICRTKIQGLFPTLVINNLVEKVGNNGYVRNNTLILLIQVICKEYDIFWEEVPFQSILF